MRPLNLDTAYVSFNVVRHLSASLNYANALMTSQSMTSLMFEAFDGWMDGFFVRMLKYPVSTKVRHRTRSTMDNSKTNSLIICPYGLKYMLECISRVALLSQSANITEITKQYLLELLDFAQAFPETNPKDVLFNFQEQWELRFFRSKNWMAETNSVPPAQVPSEAEIMRGLKKMLSHLASSTEENVLRKSPEKKSASIKATSGGKKPQLCPKPPPYDKKQTGRAIPKRRVSTVRAQQPSNVTSDNVKKNPKMPVLPPAKKAEEKPERGDYYLLTLDKSRHKRVLWIDRERIKPIHPSSQPSASAYPVQGRGGAGAYPSCHRASNPYKPLQTKPTEDTAPMLSSSLPISPVPNLPTELDKSQDCATSAIHPSIPFIHPSILFRLFGTGPRWQEPKQGSPGFPLPSHLPSSSGGTPRGSQVKREI